MNEEPKSIWKKSWKGPRAVLLRVTVFSIAIWLGTFLIMLITDWLSKTAFMAFVAIGGFTVIVAILFLTYPIIRWLCFWKNFRQFLFGLACFATLIALFYAEEDWRGWHAWNQFKHEWEAKGENLDYASVIPPAVPNEQNFALTPVIASCYENYYDKNGHKIDPRNRNVFDRLSILSWRDISYENQRAKVPDFAGWQAEQKVDLKAWQAFFRSPPPTNSVLTNSFSIAPRPQTPAEDVLLALSKYDPVIEEIRQASRLPYSRFPLTYDSEDSFSIVLPHLGALNVCAKAVRLRSVAELQNNRTELAAEDVRLGLSLANALRTEPFGISQLVRLSMVETALQPVWEGLDEHRWSESQLISLDEELAKLDFLGDCQKAQKSEIFFSAVEANYLKRHRDYANQLPQAGINYRGEVRFKFGIFRYMPGGWFYQSALKNGRTHMQYLPAINHDNMTISPTLVERADSAAKNAVSFFDPLDSLRKTFNSEFSFMGNYLKKIAYGQASVDLARTAIALERYRLARGDYPDSLDALAPQFIAKVPHDVIGGPPSQGSGATSRPLHYRRTSDSQFVLYSVGWNERDDGGVVVNQKSRNPRDESGNSLDISQGDWVWRYPQK
jgi:hypothetical protein